MGFEELCCQLAALEPRPSRATFLRKGRGPDQGVECFVTLAGGGELAWQAKYFMSGFEDGQVKNLDESLGRALEAHPALHTYFVCLPVDLSDLRVGKKPSPLQRYERWREKRIGLALLAGRSLQIHLWGASQIQERLTRDTPLYSGRLRYWFDQERLSASWFASRFEVSKANLGERYTAQSHVDLPIQQALQAVARDEAFVGEARAWSERLGRNLRDVLRALHGTDLKDACARMSAPAEALMSSLEQRLDDPAMAMPLSEWARSAGQAIEAVTGTFSASESLPEQERRHADHVLYDLYGTLQMIKTAVERTPWSLLNERRLLIMGEAGVGKSHLLAEFGVRQLASSRPFVLVLTQTLADAEPWPQMLQQLDLADCRVSEFLGALDAAAEASGCRAVVAIDALNERHGLQLWRDRLAGFVKGFEAFPRVSVVLTLRSTYEGHLPAQELPRLVHHGFAGHAGAAAKAYLDVRGIARTSSPNLLREFENPLFLRTCCDYLDKEGLKAIPKGLHGISALFGFYLQAIAAKVETKLGLDRHRSIPAAALKAFTQAAARWPHAGAVPKAEAMDLFEQFLPSQGLEGRSLFGALVAEGVLTLDVVDADDDGPEETVRFTFERLNDHLLANNLLDEHLDAEHPLQSFAREPLSRFVSAGSWWDHAGVIEALAIQLPERCDAEILDVVAQDALVLHGFEEAFLKSLLWRRQSRFSAHTMEWVSKLEADGVASVHCVLVGIATEPENTFNALELHRRLIARRMPQRDADWSVFLALDDMSEGGAVESLVDWAWHVRPEEVEPDRLLLASITLTWFLSTSNRAVRDLATKGLAHVLSRRLAVTAELLELFKDVDDPYVVERLLAACYGAALQGADAQGLVALSTQVWRQYFERGNPPLNLLSRDYARGILDYTARFAKLPEGVDLARCRGPFDTPWPLEVVSDETLSSYKVGEPNAYDDDIVSSTGQHGDFACYSIPSAIHGWTELPRSMAGQTTQLLFKAWEERFEESATLDQREAYLEVRKAAFKHGEIGWGRDWLDDDKRSARDLAWCVFQEKVVAFAGLLDDEQRAAYELEAQHHFHESVRMGRADVSPQDLNSTIVRRWVCWRAHELGWSSELFSTFERSRLISHDRMGNHRVERIGKKYQRIALGEAVARIADHLARDERDGRVGAYSGTLSELSMLRDIDPSLLVKETRETNWDYTPATWWTPATPELKPAPVAALLAWLDSPTEGFTNGPENIEVVDPRDRRDWLVVSAFRHWSIPRRHQRVHPEAWSRVTCFLTRQGSSQRLAEELLARDRGNHNFLHEDKSCSAFLGEHGWREAETGAPRLRSNSWAGIGVPTMATSVELRAESNTKDNSILQSFNLDLPSSWLIQALGLRLRDGRGPVYVDSTDVVRFTDPSLDERGTNAGVVDRQRFLTAMEAAGLEAVWLIAGEKNVYSSDSARKGFGGRVMHVMTYRLVDGALVASSRADFKAPPSTEQLSDLLAHETTKD